MTINNQKKIDQWFVTGASGMLGNRLCEYLSRKGYAVFGGSLKHPIDLPGIQETKCDLLDNNSIKQAIMDIKPDAIVHCAGLTSVDSCEENEVLAKHLHVHVTAQLARLCNKIDAKLIYISTDHLSDGKKSFVAENEPCNPVNVYGQTKLNGEKTAVEICDDCLIVRTNFFGRGRPWRKSISDWIFEALSSREPITAFTDSYFTPVGMFQLCSLLEKLYLSQATGIYNVAGSERLSKFEFANRLADFLELDSGLISPGKMRDSRLTAPRPLDMSLDMSKIENLLQFPMPNLDESFTSLKW